MNLEASSDDILMKTVHQGNSEFPYVRTDTIAYSWRFEDAGDHEHPFILTISIDGQNRSEGFEHQLSEEEAGEKALALAQEVYASAQKR
jgi:hypothetical protein